MGCIQEYTLVLVVHIHLDRDAEVIVTRPYQPGRKQHFQGPPAGIALIKQDTLYGNVIEVDIEGRIARTDGAGVAEIQGESSLPCKRAIHRHVEAVVKRVGPGAINDFFLIVQIRQREVSLVVTLGQFRRKHLLDNSDRALHAEEMHFSIESLTGLGEALIAVAGDDQDQA
jgi:hypothetical protein